MSLAIELQITAGRGPRECAYVVAEVLKVLRRDAALARVGTEVLASVPSPGPGPEAVMSALVRLTGLAAKDVADRWTGTIQWIGSSPYRASHRRKNWFVGITQETAMAATTPGATRATSYQTMRASGPGGQNVNKTNSAVRATDVESGLTVTARASRSQRQNRQAATARLDELLAERENEVRQSVNDQLWDKHQKVVRGEPIRTFRGPEFRG